MRRRDRLMRTDGKFRRATIDKVRRWLFQDGDSNGSKRIKMALEKTSVTTTQVCHNKVRALSNSQYPLQNAFSMRLHKHGFDFYRMFAPDILHEFELGVWKATFTHLMRILYAAQGDLCHAYWAAKPTSGQVTTRQAPHTTVTRRLHRSHGNKSGHGHVTRERHVSSVTSFGTSVITTPSLEQKSRE
jgi:hypothetical protein